MTLRQRWILVAALVLAVVLLDQWSKVVALNRLAGRPPIPYDLGLIQFKWIFSTNKGAFLSLGSTLPDGARIFILAGLNACILAVVSFLLFFRRALTTPIVMAMALLLAGGIGNLIDRVFRGGEVIDFMNLGITLAGRTLRTGIFNVADLAIMAGLFLLIGFELLGPRPAAQPKEEGPA